MSKNLTKLETDGGLKASDDAAETIMSEISSVVSEMLTDAKEMANASGSRRIDPGHVRAAIEERFGADDTYIAGAAYPQPSYNETEEERMQALRELQED